MYTWIACRNVGWRTPQCLWSTLTLQGKEGFFVVASMGWSPAPRRVRRAYGKRREDRSLGRSVLGT